MTATAAEVHPWDEAITDHAVVSASGTKVRRFADEVGARDFAEADDHKGDCIHVVYGPGLRNRLAVRMEGRWYTPADFDNARGMGTEASS